MKIPRFPQSLRLALLGLLTLIAATAPSLQAQRITVTESNIAPVAVESASISTEVTGRMAVTTFDLVFRNPNNRALEGSFEFPLLEGQKVVGFGLDLNGKIREAVPVEKERGRVVFEEIVRRGVDPALLEQTAGNNYRARIYPIPARGTRRVVIAYQEDLARSGADPVYHLALNFKTPLKAFRLAVNVQSGDATLAKAQTTLPLKLPAWQDRKSLIVERQQFTAVGVFDLELPSLTHPQVLTEGRGNKEYFYAEVPLGMLKPVERPIPTVVGLLWDASGSGRERDHTRELALLDAWFATVRDVEVKLTAFRNQADAPVSFKVKNGNWDELRDALKNMAYDGATSFDGLVDDLAVNEWLMFSDGLVNYGVMQSATQLPLRAPVHTVLASAQANPALLRGLAQRQAGEFVNLLVTTAPEAARLLRNESCRVLKIEYPAGELAQVFPERNAVVNEGALVVTGILQSPPVTSGLIDPPATIRLLIGHTKADARETTLTIKSGENPSQLAARAWATTKIASLETDLAANREDIRRTSQKFGIVTADTSLIVLETLQDYLRYDIVPPEELRAEWDANHRDAAGNNQKGQNLQLDLIARLFDEKVKWWETKFSQEKPPAPIAVASAPIPAPLPANVTPAPAATQQTTPAGNTPRLSQPTVPSKLPGSEGEEVVVLTPFEVTTQREGYYAANTMAGTRINLRVQSVATSDQMGDIEAGPAPSARTIRSTSSTRPASSTSAPAAAAAAPAKESESPAARTPAVVTPTNITLQHWDAKAGYLDRLRRATPENRYSIYREERADHLLQPGFFLDVAEFFFQEKESALALRILSNLAELQLDDPALLRVLAHRLVQADRPELALPLFERVLKMRPEEPQSRRDLALVCTALKQHQRAVDLLWEVVAKAWDGRFPEIEIIALGELNAIIATCGEKLDLSRIDARFLKNLPVGLRVILTWDTDACDIDLWVNDPNGEQAIYSHPRTFQGGRMSRDFTGGYGPEEFLLRNPKAGKYGIKINYFGDRRQTALGPVTAQIRLITGFGTAAEKEQRLTLRLSERQETLQVGEIQIGE